MTFIIFTIKLAALLWTVAVSLAEAMFWAVHLLIGGARIGVDAVLARRRIRGGVLTCPRGHQFPVNADDIEIECACGWRSKGNALKCANPECRERHAPFVSCPTCSLSVRNPYRLGRPR